MINTNMLLLTGLIGLIFGSFLNVVALRMLSNESLVFPASHCTSCNHKLGVFDLFPVLSYVFLRGKCRYCGEHIPAVYPFGELLTALSFMVVVYHYGWSLPALLHVIFISLMIVATVTDLKETIVPDRIVVIGLISIFIMRLIVGERVVFYLLSSLGAFGLLFAIFVASLGRMGGADVKIYALIGLAIGFSNSVASLFYASILSLIYHLPFLIKGTWNRDKEIPFLPFITVAILITYFINIYNYLPN